MAKPSPKVVPLKAAKSERAKVAIPTDGAEEVTPDREAALAYHVGDRPGKIEVVPTKPVATQRDLSLAYSPGVAEPCREIHAHRALVNKYTARGNLVAVPRSESALARPVATGLGWTTLVWSAS